MGMNTGSPSCEEKDVLLKRSARLDDSDTSKAECNRGGLLPAARRVHEEGETPGGREEG